MCAGCGAITCYNDRIISPSDQETNQMKLEKILNAHKISIR